MKPSSGFCATLVLGAVVLVAGCQKTGEQLAGLDGETLKAPEVSELPGGSVLVTMETRKGATQTFALIKAEKPVANVLLFAGGGGMLKLKRNTRTGSGMDRVWAENNFLIRSKEEFISRGLNAVLIDAPSDKQGRNGMMGGFRNSARHVKDLEGVIDFVKRRNGLPVWLVGTSRGTESAAFVTIHSRMPVNGMVLTSSVTVGGRSGTAVTSYPLEKVRVPVQIVFHEKDGCESSPPSGAKAIARALTNAAKVEVKAFDGGDPAISEPCKGRSEHGFWGIEGRVVESIAAFIKANF